MEQESQIKAVLPVEAPRGMYPGKLDDKGRIKLPTNFQQYLNSFKENKFFITSLDRRLAQIYPMPVWRDVEKFLDNFTESPTAARNIAFNAADLGSDAEMDSQGRITLNPELRRQLDLEGHDLHLYVTQGRVEILSEALYQQQKLAATRDTDGDLLILRKAGLR